MQEYCVGSGYCGSVIDGKPSYVTDYLPKKGLIAADQFVNLLIQAEGMDFYEFSVRYNKKYKNLIKVFTKHMGTYEVDVSLLK